MEFSTIDYLEFTKGIIDVNTNTDTLPPVKRHYVGQAKTLLYGIDKIHFLGEQPGVYFKAVPHFQEETLVELAKVQKSVWNQGKVPFLLVESPTEIRVYNGFEKPINPNDENADIKQLELYRTKRDDSRALEELQSVCGAASIDSGDFWKQSD